MGIFKNDDQKSSQFGFDEKSMAGKAVKAVRHGHGLYAVGDELTAGQGIHHALVRHGNAVADGDGGELHGHAARHENALLRRVGNAAQVEVAGNDLIEGVHNADERLAAYVLLKMTGCVQQAARVGVLRAGIYLFILFPRLRGKFEPRRFGRAQSPTECENRFPCHPSV